MKAHANEPAIIPVGESPVVLAFHYNAAAAHVEELDKSFLGKTKVEEIDELCQSVTSCYGGGRQFAHMDHGRRALHFHFRHYDQAEKAGRDLARTVADVAGLERSEVGWHVVA